MYSEERNPFFDIRRESVTTDSGLDVPKIALINNETNDILGLVSRNYELITNKSVKSLFDGALEGLKVADIQDHLDATTKRWCRRMIFKEDCFRFEAVPGDVIGVLLEIFNGYDARTSFGYELMGYRFACNNGQILGKRSLFRESYAHYVDNPQKLRLSIDSKMDGFKEYIEMWAKWSKEQFTQNDFDDFVDSRKYLGKRVKKFIKDSYEDVMDKQNLDKSRYGAYNVLTFLSTHNTMARKGSGIFSSRYNMIVRVVSDFYEYDGHL